MATDTRNNGQKRENERPTTTEDTESRALTLNDAEVAYTRTMMAMNEFMTMRTQYMKDLFDPRRNINQECGYPDRISQADYTYMFEREGVGSRVVSLFPEECWREDPEIIETPDPDLTDFEQAWIDLEEKQNIYHYLQRIDVISGIGHFGVVLLGVNDGKDLKEPIEGFEKGYPAGDGGMALEQVQKDHELMYLRVFPESLVRIARYENDPNEPRYGRPILYNIKFNDPNVRADGSSAPMDSTERPVHWSRVIHVADNRQASEVFGTPRMQQVWNRLYDIRKIMGGSGEMFWKGGFPGLSFELQPGLTDVEIDKSALREEIARYSNGLQRYLAVEGLTTKSLAPQVADPDGHAMAQMRMISIALGVPMRVLMGAEAGHLASTQDAVSWNGRLQYRQRRYLTPLLVKPFVDRLIMLNILPLPAEAKYEVKWQDLNQPSEEDKANVAKLWTEALAKYMQSGAEQVVPPLEYLTMVLGVPEDEAEAILESALQRIKEIEEEQRKMIEEMDDDPNAVPPEEQEQQSPPNPQQPA